MDFFLGKVTQQAMNYAIRSGVTLTASYAIRQSSKLLQNASKSDVKDELVALHQRLSHKLSIVSPAIDMIELIAARGNTSLESAVSLTKELRLEIEEISQKFAHANATAEEYRIGSSRGKAILKAQNELELQRLVQDVKRLLSRIEDAVPLINLALTTSGAKLSTQLPSTVSPSRLLQASAFLSAGDVKYATSPNEVIQIGPTFTLTVYMLFAGHNRPQSEEEIRDTTWKEVIHKARVKLRRVPLDVVLSTGSGSDALPSVEISPEKVPYSEQHQSSHVRADARADEFAYQLMIVEDFDDDRIHDFDDEEAQPGPFDDIRLAGIREMIPIHEVSKIFYADTSKVLNIGNDAESNHPVLLLKRDVNAIPPRKMVEKEKWDIEEHTKSDSPANKSREEKQHIKDDHADRKQDPWRLPPSLDPEWIALEVYTEAEGSDEESEQDERTSTNQASREHSSTPQIEKSMANLSIDSPLPNSNSQLSLSRSTHQPPKLWAPQVKTSLSLLELLLRLTSLQQFQQQSHLSITDELLNFFLEESATTGAGGDEGHRQALRADARRRVGWDPYDESPLKRRGEDYQYQRPYQDFQDAQDFYGETPRSHSYRGAESPDPNIQSPSGGAQTRSITGTPSDTGYRNSSPKSTPGSNQGVQSRPEWLRRQESEKRGSPLRPKTARSDEGIGTSPASIGSDSKQSK